MQLWDNARYNRKTVINGLVLTGVMLLACKFTGSIAYVLFYPIVIIAFGRNKPEKALLVTLLMAAFLCANSFFVPKTVIYGYLQRAGIMLTGCILFMSFLSRGISPLIRPLWGIVFYVLYMIFPSMDGWSPIVSTLKIILFLLTITAWFGLGNMVLKSFVDARRLRSAVLCYAIFMLVGSFALLPFPSIGQMGMADFTAAEIAEHLTMTSLFKGMTQHSQAMGPVAAMTIVLVLGDYIFGIRRNNWLYNILLFCGAVVLWRTSSRTAMCTMLFGVGVLFLSLSQARLQNRSWKTKVRNAFLMMGILLTLVLAIVPSTRASILKFVVKYNTQDKDVIEHVTLADITSSRRGALENPIANWRKKPLLGNGFQVSVDMSWIKERDIKHLLSAPVEKGTWIVAVLEEGGVIGMLILLAWICNVLMVFSKRKCYIGTAAFLTLLVANLGEFSMFSLSYIGSLEWVLVVAAVILDASRSGISENRQVVFNRVGRFPT